MIKEMATMRMSLSGMQEKLKLMQFQVDSQKSSLDHMNTRVEMNAATIRADSEAVQEI